jgi:hypothetical protein
MLLWSVGALVADMVVVVVVVWKSISVSFSLLSRSFEALAGF